MRITCWLLLLGLTPLLACCHAGKPGGVGEPPAPHFAADDALEALGAGGVLLALPLRMETEAGRPWVMRAGAESLALLLERAGHRRVEVSHRAFEPGPAADRDTSATARAFQRFVREGDWSGTEALLWVELIGRPGPGEKKIRALLCHGDGRVLWADEVQGDDAAWRAGRVACPLSASALLVARLAPALGLDDPRRSDAPEGRWARWWETEMQRRTETENKED